jgi:hypothetical protein
MAKDKSQRHEDTTVSLQALKDHFNSSKSERRLLLSHRHVIDRRVLPAMPWPVDENVLEWRPMGTQASPDESVEIVPLGGSLQPLKDHFNSNKGKRRFLALLSPT